MYKAGDKIERTVGGQTESVKLPAVDLGHLRALKVNGNKVRGFHTLPSAVARIASTNPITLTAGAIAVVDQSGAPIVGAQVRLTPHRVPADAYDAFEAKVEVLDATGAVIASDAAKSFYPQAWTEDQIQEAIYATVGDNTLTVAKRSGPRIKSRKRFTQLTRTTTARAAVRSSSARC